MASQTVFLPGERCCARVRTCFLQLFCPVQVSTLAWLAYGHRVLPRGKLRPKVSQAWHSHG